MDEIGTVGPAGPTPAGASNGLDDAELEAQFNEAISRGAISVGSLWITDNIAEIQKEPPQT